MKGAGKFNLPTFPTNVTFGFRSDKLSAGELFPSFSFPYPHLLAGNLKVNGLERSLTVPLAKIKKTKQHNKQGSRQTCTDGIYTRATLGSQLPDLSPAPREAGLPPWAVSPPADAQGAGGRWGAVSWIHWGLLEAGRVQVLSRGPASTPAQEGSALLPRPGVLCGGLLVYI